MSPEDRELLEKAVELGEENKRMIKQIRNSMRWARIVQIIYWLVIIGVAIGAFYYLQPYLQQLLQLYNDFGDGVDSIKGFLGS